jgi:hypothetical protein
VASALAPIARNALMASNVRLIKGQRITRIKSSSADRLTLLACQQQVNSCPAHTMAKQISAVGLLFAAAIAI